MAAKLGGVFLECAAAIPHLRDGAQITMTRSLLDARPRASLAAYVASKAGAGALANTVALELASRPITVNVVPPGCFDSPLAASCEHNSALADELLGHTRLRRWGTNEDLPGALLFLASPTSDLVTGAVRSVDEGYQCI